jgi:hypothetical protein
MRYVSLFACCLTTACLLAACNRPSTTNGPIDRGPSTETADAEQPAAQVEQHPTAPAPESESAERLDAEVVLAGALGEAKSADKRVFIHVGAPW